VGRTSSNISRCSYNRTRPAEGEYTVLVFSGNRDKIDWQDEPQGYLYPGPITGFSHNDEPDRSSRIDVQLEWNGYFGNYELSYDGRVFLI